MPGNGRKQPQERRRDESGLFTTGRPYVPDEFALDVLRILPDEGTKRGKYIPDEMNVGQIKRKLDPTLTSGWIGARLRLMAQAGLIVAVTSSGEVAKRGHGWQRTAAGKNLVEPTEGG